MIAYTVRRLLLALVEDAIGGDVALRLGIDAQTQIGGARHQLIGVEHRRCRLLHRLPQRFVESAIAGAHAVTGDDGRLTQRASADVWREPKSKVSREPKWSVESAPAIVSGFAAPAGRVTGRGPHE